MSKCSCCGLEPCAHATLHKQGKVILPHQELELEITKLKQMLAVAEEALEFYENKRNYEYIPEAAANYIWNDNGKRARETQAEIKKLRDDK